MYSFVQYFERHLLSSLGCYKLVAFGNKFVTIYILGLSTFSAGPRVAGKANPTQALPIALTISEGLVGVCLCRQSGANLRALQPK